MGGGDRELLAVDGISEVSREDWSIGLESGELPAVDVALVGVLGSLLSTGSSSGNGRFSDGTATVKSVMVGNCRQPWFAVDNGGSEARVEGREECIGRVWLRLWLWKSRRGW